MCGICGFSWEDTQLLEHMKRSIAHRGPDGEGSYVGGGVSLGHRRLSIIDLSERGRQPMRNDRNVYVSFNGEIYNYPSLRRRLESKGYVFKSDADTEVILHAYSEYGRDFASELIGMFAIALWDEPAKKWLLVRDRLGLKPLYYYFKSGRLIFGSEIKAILCEPSVERSVENQSLYHLLGYEYVPGPDTLFKGIKKLDPGSMLEYQGGKAPTLHRYWSLEQHDIDARPEAFYELFETVCEDHMLADVEVGAFLSGGLDSSSIVSALSNSQSSLKTLSLGYEESSYSEFDYARLVAEHFGTDHKELLIAPVGSETVGKCIWHLDEPVTDPSTMPFMLLCETARSQAKVWQSGDGGDELLMGYDRIKANKIARWLEILPDFLLSGIANALVNRIPDNAKKKGASNMLLRFTEGLLYPRAAGAMRWQYFLLPEYQQKLFRPEFLESINPVPMGPTLEAVRREGSSGPKNDQYVELTTWLPDCALMKVDKMSMAQGVEIRAPFLDHRLVEYCYSLATSEKLRGFTSKWILRQAMRDRLPQKILDRGKQGFAFPMKNWLRNDFGEMARESLLNSDVISSSFEEKYVAQLWDEHLTMKRNHSHLIWNLVNIATWEKTFLHQGELAPLSAAVS
jgi:asparagine synthase (glutamine-hydrolysing)